MSALAPQLVSRMQSYDSRVSIDGLSDANLQSGNTSTDATSVSSQEEVAHVPENTAIVGMACRLPGAKSPQQLWKNIVDQRDVQRKIPKERFNVDAFYHPEGTNKGTTNARYGYFLDDDVSEFDPEFFQISGKEAEAMDPQQRLLLEVVYEALENAGITLDEISGTETSVFCGSFTNDYREMIHKDLEHYPKYSVTGTGAAILANRISYFYNLHGPSVTLDTACSSSLVGLHMGNQSIRDGEADISIVVGSALHFDPTIYTTMTDLGFLSVDGRCRAFDAGGSGYVRGEGICAVILKRKSQAQMDGNNIRAIIRGTGCNHDGIKEGITMPNSVAQEALIRRVYKNTGLNTNETQYFEAHGTGTQAGDPRETRAIGAVFAPNRDRPLYVGSVKTNIGHLEGASGLAGVIKTTMSLEAGKILPNMLFNNPNPKIDFEQWKITVPTKIIDWEPTNGVRRASVNSFGYGGTNAHIILEGYNKPAVVEEVVKLIPEYEEMVSERPFLLPLTSHTEKAGNLLKNNLSTFIAGENVSAPDAALSLSNPGRSNHQYRSYVIGQDSDEMIEKLSTTTGGTPWTRATKTKPRIGYVFTGQGAQHYHMGRELLEKCPMFKQSIQKCDEILQSLEAPPSWSVLTELMKSKEDSLVNGIEFSSSLATAIQLSTIDLLRAWGVEPAAVCGHSAGEIPASYAAGILSFKDALACAYYRGCALSGEPEDKVQIPGAMVAVGMTESEAIVELEKYGGAVKIAAVNSPTSLTLSGDEPQVVELQKSLEDRKVFARRLAVERAYHSHHIAPYAPELTRLSRNVRPRPATCRMFSSVTARIAEWQKMTGAYYALNLVNQVRFSDALTGILIDENEEQNVDVLIEIGAHPALKGPSRQTIQALKLDVPYLATIARGANDFEGMLATVGQLYAMGYPVDLEAVNSDLFLGSDGAVVRAPAGKTVDLPSYSWDHSKYWAETRLVKSYRNRAHRHSILGAPMLGNLEKHPRWRSFLRPRELQWLPHHMIDGKVIFPAAGYLTMAIEAAVRLETCPKNIKAICLRDIAIKSALTVSDSEMGTEVIFEMQPVSTSAKRTSDTWYRFIINSFGDNGVVNEHCYGLISVEAGDSTAIETDTPAPSLAQLRKRSDRCTTSKTFYEHLWNIGLQYGEDFQLITGNVDSGSGYSMAPISLKPAALMTTPNDHCVIHPSFLDASFHPFFAGIESLLGRPLDGPFVPTFMKYLKLSGAFFDLTQGTAEHTLWATAETKLPGPRVAISDITVRSADCSEILIDMQGLEATALGSSTAETSRQLFFRTRWQPAFDNLAGTAELSALKTPAEIMDVYAHQYPDTKILHITSDLAATKELLTTLFPQQRRRFQSITPYCGSEEQFEDIEALTKVYSTLIDTAEPKEGAYDLVVVSKTTSLDVKSFLNSTGHVIVAGGEYDGQGMSVLFQNSSFTAYTEAYSSNYTAKPLTLVMGKKVSETTEALAQLITSKQTAPVTRMSFVDMVENAPATENVIVLASLDQELFFEDPEHEEIHFEAVRTFFTSENKNIVWIVRGASQETSNPAQAMILGMCRVARNENDKLKVVTLDVAETAQNGQIAEQINTILDSRLTEDEYAARNGTLSIPKIETDDLLNNKLPENSGGDAVMQEFGAGQPLALKIGKVGLLETLAFGVDEDIVDTELAADSIEVEVKASAINFRDVAASIGIIDDYRLGDECAGVVLRIGSAVNPNDFQVGDRVVAFRPGQGAHRSIVREQAALCYKLPENISFTTAAAFTCIMITAYYAFHDLARLQPGEKVLIHAAAGGVGQMAIQVAQMMGAEVIATCGSQAKRDLLKSTYGLTDDHIFSSRDPSFVADINRLTNGKGVDVVLNSLAGDLLHATWACVARFGRFIEIGKRDIHENAKIDMEPFRKSVGFASLDLITMYEYNKPLSHRLLNETYKLLEQGKINNPHSVLELPYSEAEKGFRLLQMGKHTGKIVLVPHKDDIVPVSLPSYRKTMLFSPEKSYLLSGGLGGLGRTMAEWMVRKGARQLAFLSRSGDARPEAKATVEWLQARDIKVTIFKVDVSDYAAVTKAVQSLGDNLAGIFHAAVVLQDAPLNTMSLKQWQGCVHPKVQGAWNLHRATLHLDLDFFTPFSSVACQVGAMGQTNYAAANTYLDALVRYRRSIGLKASSMNCGMIVGVGLVAENESILNWLIKMGSDGVNEDELLYQIEEAVVGGSAPTQLTARGIDPAATTTGVQTARNDVYWHGRAFFRNLYSNFDVAGAGAAKGGNSLGALLQAAKDVPERAQILTEAFIEKIAAVLGVVAETIQPGNPLSMYGLDSIVAVEFRKWFSKTINVDIALFDILSSKSIALLVLKAASLMVIEVAASEKSKGSSEETKGSAAVSEQATAGEQSSDFDAISIARPSNIPMSTFQRRMWYAHNLVEDKSALNICITSHIKGTPDATIFKAALDELKRRNEMLRTAYSEGDDFAEQEPVADFDSRLVYRDLSTEIDVDASLESWRASLQGEELDIENGEIMRPGLFKLGDEKFAFVVAFHHISIDRGSSKALFEQFVEIYDAIRLEKDLASVAPPRISYTDFSIWYENHLRSAGLQSEVEFWKQRLAGIKPTSELLPFAKTTRPDTMDRVRDELRSTLPLSMLLRLKRVCARMGTTPFQFMLAAFRAFLFRYTEEEDVTVLVIDGNRPRSDLEDVLGFFVNMIPVRLNNVDSDSLFDSVLSSTKSATVEAIEHSKIPFDTIVEAVNLPKSHSIFPISQVVVNYQMHGKMPRFGTEDFHIHTVINHDIPTACELALEALEDPDKGLDLRLEYSTTLYAEADMERFFDNFSTFLTSLIRDHRQPIAQTQMTGPKEVEHLKTNYWNMGFTENTWKGASVVEKILKKAEETPDALAIQTAENGNLTYKQLVDQAQRIAATLEQANIAPGTSVGVLASPGADAVVAMVGALIRGCGYLAMDPEFAAQRLSFMASDSAVKLILVGEDLESVGCAVAAKTTSPPQVMPIAVAKSSNEKSSTGIPKGVVLSQSNTQQMLSTLQHDYSFTSNDKFLHQSSMCFDLSIVQIFSALTSGATVCIASTPVRKDPARLAKFIQEAGVTVTYFTPTHFALLMESSADLFRLCSDYRIAFFAGERLSARVVDKFRALKTPAMILNTWSPSELVVQTTIHEVAESETGDVNIPIGFPMANCRHYILDTQMNPLPAGLVGEICVGGSQVGSGYLNRPEANAASFVQDPFCSADDISRGWTRLFRTGDKGRFLADGKLEFHGRIAGDKQIKLRGFRVDLGEVEHRIHLEASKLTGPKLVDISMVARTLDGKESYTDERQLIAYIVLNSQIAPKEQVKYVTTIHKAIAKDLNPYMLPNGYQFLTELPMTIGRKVDRQSLLTRELTLVYPSSKSNEPAAETNLGGDQQKVLDTIFQLYRDVLKLPKDREIGVTDNFFELGGQSILLLRLQAKLKRTYKKATPSLPELFKAPTPLAICQKICGLAATPAAGASKAAAAAVKQIINWTAEATLPSDKRYLVRYGASTLSSSDITSVLLTGVESFIGLHVFANMLSLEPTKHFHLLGSEKSIQVDDVIADLKQYKLLKGTVTEELVRSQTNIVPGSLMQPGLGLEKTTFSQLGRSIQAIYHLGGRMSLLKNYETLRRANAGATMDLIELAASGLHRTELHYLSTWSVPHLQSHAAAKRNRTHIDISESSPDHFTPSEDAELFYFKSRWVSEMLLTHAAERGFNVSIIRASAVSGSTATNVPAPDDDFVRRMIVDMVTLGSVPDLHGPAGTPAYAIDFIPVNYLSSALQSLTTSDALRDEKSFTKKNLSIFHIGNPSPMNLHDLPKLMTQLRVDEKEGKLVSLPDWLAEMKAKAKTEGDVLRWEAVKNVCETGHLMFALDQTETQKALEEVDSELTCPPMDKAFLKMLGA